MKIAYFTHSLISCWNHGNAHFLRGVLRELRRLGHDVQAFEPTRSWSRENLIKEAGLEAIRLFPKVFPDLDAQFYDPDADLNPLLEDAEVVIAHEWNEPQVIAGLGRIRRQGAPFVLLFHDTHHRAISDPDFEKNTRLEGFDAILAFGASLAEAYRDRGYAGPVFVWREAADTDLFHPPPCARERNGLVFIGNWGDDERTNELERFLFRPAHDLQLAVDVFGVRYPAQALAAIDAYGGVYHGWLANHCAPEIFARHMASVHVPRRFYVERLPGIPTIRVFEALACGIPLLCSEWRDDERLFRPGDYLVARTENEMRDLMRAVAADADLRDNLARRGHATILARHTCAHRAAELMAIVERLDQPATQEAIA